MRELLEQIAFEARSAGVDALVVDGEFPEGDDIAYVVVPHEYFVVRPAHLYPSTEMLSRTIALTVEHPGTPWFEVTADHARRCGMIMDINTDSTAELQRRGLTVLHFQLGYSQYFDEWHGRDQPRPTDIVYMGSSDVKRDAALASYTRWWTGRKVNLLIPSEAPRTRASGAYLTGNEKHRLLGQSQILVNLHRGESRALEWVRVLEAMANGAVVVSEHSVDSLPLIAGEHFVSAGPQTIGLLTSHLLQDEKQLGEMRAAAYDFIRDQLPLSRSVEQLLEAAHQLVRCPLMPHHRPDPPPPRRQRPPPWETEDASPIALLGAEVSRLRHRIRELESAQAHVQGQAGYRGDGVVPLLQSRLYAAARPRISVLIPVFNKAPLVASAMDSVLACGRSDVEILLLDDMSTDQSRQRIMQWIREHPHTPASLLARRFNGGVSRARNSLLSRARGEFVFTLDADNGVYPTALDTFVEALDADPAKSFAYGPIEIRQNETYAGLLSTRPLDPEELRWGNYVDSMAMFRTAALRELNGWNEAMHTWEDYELWLRLLESGRSGVFVQQTHTWYGTHEGTLRTAAGLEMVGLWSQLRTSAPTIFADRPQVIAPGPDH